MASLAGFSLTWIDGVLGKSVSDKALPFVSRNLLQWTEPSVDC